MRIGLYKLSRRREINEKRNGEKVKDVGCVVNFHRIQTLYISEYDSLHNLTDPTSSECLWLTSDRRTLGLATRSWANGIDCRKEILNTSSGGLRMKDSLSNPRAKQPWASLCRGYVRSICRLLKPQNDRRVSKSRIIDLDVLCSCLFLEPDVCQKRQSEILPGNSSRKHVREEKSGLYRSPLAPIRAAYLQADTSATVNAY